MTVSGQPKPKIPARDGGSRATGRRTTKPLWATVVGTQEGYAAVAASAYGVVACTWRHDTVDEAQRSLLSILRPQTANGEYAPPVFMCPTQGLIPHLAAARAGLQAYGAGDYNSLRDLEIDSRVRSQFVSRVFKVVQSIPAGSVLSYGQVAQRAGSKGGARAVGQVMGNNPLAPIVPCHRVIAAGGRIGGFGPGIPAKVRLLQREGVDADERGVGYRRAGDGRQERLSF